jgi:hypothetical protein
MGVHHFHFGAGALGLGLVVPTFEYRVDAVSVINRASTDGTARLGAIALNNGYRLEVFSAHGKNGNTSRTIEVEHCVGYGELAAHSHSALAGATAVLLTTSLKRRGIEESLEQLDAVCRAAEDRGLPVALLAAENQVDSCWVRDRIADRIAGAGSIHAVRCVVDRICNKPTLQGAAGTAGGLTVLAEEFARIYVCARDVDALPEPLATCLAVRPSDSIEHVSDFEAVVTRKKWVVNAAHLLLALFAHWNRFPTLHGFVESSPNFVDRLVDDVSRMSFSAMQGGVAILKDEDRKFVSGLKARLGKFPQRPFDAVTRLTSSDHIDEFLEDFHRKVVEPYLAAPSVVLGRSRVPFLPSHITMCAIDLIKNRQWIRPS